jgi:O-antigen ligase
VIAFLSMIAAVLYCFAWLRPPEIAGVALPVQRMVGWLGLALIVSRLLVKGSLVAGPAARGFLRLVALFLVFLLLLFVRQLAYGDNFFPLYFIMDLSKYAAAFAMAYLCYYALSTRLVDERRFHHGIILSGGLATVFVFLFLGLYFAGFRTENEILAPSFGGALGVWPTGGWLPRLSGPTAEPQQLSVALLTPLLLMLGREHIRHYWPLALVTASALLLSQSKFAVISLLFVMLYLFLVYRRWRKLIAVGVLASMPVLVLALIRLPTFTETLEAGFSAGSIVERLGNIVLLVGIIREHPLFGIGPGHYGVYWGQALYGDWRYNPGYSPNMDFLKVFAETGVAGFLLILLLLGYLVRLFARSYRRLPVQDRSRYLALFLGALAIMLNMTIGYELLHAFFWINIGALLYRVDHSVGTGGGAPSPPYQTEIAPRPVARP